jgi:hypothetical protein
VVAIAAAEAEDWVELDPVRSDALLPFLLVEEADAGERRGSREIRYMSRTSAGRLGARWWPPGPSTVRADDDAELAHQRIGNSVIIMLPVLGSAITRLVSPSRIGWIPTNLARTG